VLTWTEARTVLLVLGALIAMAAEVVNLTGRGTGCLLAVSGRPNEKGAPRQGALDRCLPCLREHHLTPARGPASGRRGRG
jgi:hypothetical protein